MRPKPHAPDESRDPAVRVDVEHRIGSLDMGAKFAVTAPWTVLFGPSGSGKSTILRIIAGLVKPDAGRVTVGAKVVVDRAAGVWIPPHLRPVRWAGQRAALFPRKTVRLNVAAGIDGFGNAWGDQTEWALEHFGLREMQDLLPGELSGGQRQRVSVVRAAVGAQGRVLLLDEPFSGLDEGVRAALAGQLRAWLGETPVISVTHDVGEAFLLGAEVVRVDDGRVLAQGPVGDVLDEERSRLREVLG